jgi:hypothetical protein
MARCHQAPLRSFQEWVQSFSHTWSIPGAGESKDLPSRAARPLHSRMGMEGAPPTGGKSLPLLSVVKRMSQ